MTTIPEEARDAIAQLANNYSGTEEDLVEMYGDLLDEEAEKGVSNPQKRALRRLSLEVKGSSTSGAEQMRGVVMGASDPINTSRGAINRAKDFIQNAGVAKAVKHGLVKEVPSGDLPDQLASLTVKDGDGEEAVLAILDSNENSPTSGEILPAEDYIRYVYGVVYREPGSSPRWFSGVIDGDEASDVPPVPPKHQPVQFRAAWVGDSNRNNTVRLRFQDEEPFEVTEDGPDVIELLEDGDDGVGHVSLDQANADNYGRDDIVATYGSVTYMELAPEGDQSRRLNVVDPFAFDDDLSRTVWLPEHTEVDFAEESDVYVVGQVSKSNNEYPDSIEAVGVVPHPDYRVDLSGIESMEGESSEQQADSGGESVDAAEAEADAEFETGATIEESEQAEAAEEGAHLPPVVKDAGYTDLQSVASGVEEVPGSGIDEDEMRDRLVDAIGAEALAEELAGDADGRADDEAPAATTDGGPADGPDGAERGADESRGEAVTDDDMGDFEPDEQDSEWEW